MLRDQIAMCIVAACAAGIMFGLAAVMVAPVSPLRVDREGCTNAR